MYYSILANVGVCQAVTVCLVTLLACGMCAEESVRWSLAHLSLSDYAFMSPPHFCMELTTALVHAWYPNHVRALMLHDQVYLPFWEKLIILSARH